MFRDGGKPPMVGLRLSGKKVNLRPLRGADLPRRAEWLKDAGTFRLYAGTEPTRAYEYADARRWREALESDLGAMVWAIEAKEGRHIGDVDLHNIDRYQGSAKLTILLGDKAFWDRGCGTDAIETLLGYAFAGLGLGSVNLRVYDFNKRAIRCYEKCGFVHAGTVPRYPEAVPGPTELYMVVTKDCFLSRKPDAIAVRT